MENACIQKEPEFYNTPDGVLTAEEMKRRQDNEQDNKGCVCDEEQCN